MKEREVHRLRQGYRQKIRERDIEEESEIGRDRETDREKESERERKKREREMCKFSMGEVICQLRQWVNNGAIKPPPSLAKHAAQCPRESSLNHTTCTI